MDSDGASIEEIVDPGRVAIININYNDQIFADIFSKMEFTMAWDFLREPVEKYSIPMLFTGRKRKGEIKNNLGGYLKRKESVRSSHTAPPSPLDGKFMKQFSELLPNEKSAFLEVPHEDIFLDSRVIDWVRGTGKETIMFTGFFTERDVYISAMEALMRGYFSVIISDATSTYSERIFFTSLDLISQSVEVIDTRDLEKIW